MKKFMKKTEGFTLVELIVVIAILGILAGVGTVGYSGYIKKANEAVDNQLISDLQYMAIIGAIENPEVSGKITVSNSGATVGDGTYKDTITEWLQDSFGDSWSTAVKFKTAGLTKSVYLPVRQIALSADEQGWVNKINGSSFSGQYEEVAGSIAQLSQTMSGAVTAGQTGALSEVLGETEYQEYLANLGLSLDDTERATEIGNVTAFFVASQVKDMSSTDAYSNLKDALSTGTPEDMVASLKAAGNGSSLAGLALGYGVATAYLNSEYISADSKATLSAAGNGVTGITTMMGYLDTVSKDANFDKYIKSSTAQNDVDAYLGAMSLIDNYSGEIDTKTEGVYSNDSTLALLQALLGV